MVVRPGRRFEILFQFIPEPRSEIMSASSSFVHFVFCFFAGDADGCGAVGGALLVFSANEESTATGRADSRGRGS